MIQRTQKLECTWFNIRCSISEYFPSKLEEYDKFIEEGNKRGALKIAQDVNIISPDSWVWF